MGTPTAEQLAQTVLIGALDSILERWTPGIGCVAWIDSADRRCEKPADGYICKRHHNVAVKRWEKEAAKIDARRTKAAEHRAANLPKWREELAKVQAEIVRLDPPRPTDRAAYTGAVHPSIERKRRAFMSDSRIQKMAELWRRHDELANKIGDNK